MKPSSSDPDRNDCFLIAKEAQLREEIADAATDPASAGNQLPPVLVEPEDGGTCPECHEGTLGYHIRNCSCHINPPCSSCENSRLECDKCGWEEPEREPSPPPTQEQRNSWAKYLQEMEEARQRGHTFPHGGRIFNVSYDGRSGSTMVFRGQYEGPVTASDILSHLGTGSFGHRGPALGNGRFTFTKITD